MSGSTSSTLVGEHMSGSPTQKALLSLAYLILFGSFLAYSAYLYLLKTVRPALATSYAFVNPVVAVILGTLLLGEPVAPGMAVGGGLIIAAVAALVASMPSTAH